MNSRYALCDTIDKLLTVPGGPAGVMVNEAGAITVAGALVPVAFVAVRLHVTVVPLARPNTLIGCVGSVLVLVIVPQVAV